MALFTRTAKLDPGAHGARCTRAMAVHHAVGISCQRNSGYRPSMVNIMVQGLSTPDPSLSPTHLSTRRGRATTTRQVSLMVSRNTTLVPSLGLRIGPACEAGFSVGIRRERVPPQRIKIKKKTYHKTLCWSEWTVGVTVSCHTLSCSNAGSTCVAKDCSRLRNKLVHWHIYFHAVFQRLELAEQLHTSSNVKPFVDAEYLHYIQRHKTPLSICFDFSAFVKSRLASRQKDGMSIDVLMWQNMTFQEIN